MMLSVVLTPLAVEVIDLLYGADVHVNPLTVAKWRSESSCSLSASG